MSGACGAAPSVNLLTLPIRLGQRLARMVRLLLLIAAIAMAAAQVQAIVLHIDEATCHSLGVTMDVTYSELAVMPPYATVSVQSE